jgi:hypothetical protein
MEAEAETALSEEEGTGEEEEEAGKGERDGEEGGEEGGEGGRHSNGSPFPTQLATLPISQVRIVYNDDLHAPLQTLPRPAHVAFVWRMCPARRRPVT